jgi:hypothetical protein
MFVVSFFLVRIVIDVAVKGRQRARSWLDLRGEQRKHRRDTFVGTADRVVGSQG